MSFRARIALLTAVAIAVTVAGASFAVWVVAKHELFSQLDSTLILPGEYAAATARSAATA